MFLVFIIPQCILCIDIDTLTSTGKTDDEDVERVGPGYEGCNFGYKLVSPVTSFKTMKIRITQL
jgi:hypothetical protein